MNKKGADTQSGVEEVASTNTRAMQPRTGRIKQVRRLREKSTMPLLNAASLASLTENGKAPTQGRLRQLKATKQLATRGGSVEQPKVGFARPMQQRQVSARKSVQPAGLFGVGKSPVEDKTSLSRTAQMKQFGTKKRASLSAQSK